MITFEEFKTQIGSVSATLLTNEEYQRWLSENPDSIVLGTTPMLLVVHQRLPGAEQLS